MPNTAAVPSTEAAQAAAARLAGMRPPPARPGPGTAEPEPTKAKGAEKEKGKEGKAEAGDEGGKRKKLLIKVAAGLALLLVVGYVVKGKVLKPHYGPSDPPPAGQILSLGTVTTNLSDGHLAQVAISLQLTAPASLKTITKEEAAMVATAVTDLGQETYAQLIAPAGRAALEHRLLVAYQAEAGTAEGGQQVSAVYFTQFVLQ